jgi:hypothetical protein
MHHFKATFLLITSVALLASKSGAVPVYLKPSSLFSSGSFPREALERKTRETQLEAWLKIKTKDNKVGWLPSEYVITPLELAKFVYSRGPTRIRTTAQMESLNAYTWPPDLKLKILEMKGDWILCERLTDLSGPKISWMRSHELKIKDEKFAKAWMKKATALKSSSAKNSSSLETLRAHQLVEVLNESGEFLKVQSESFEGYIKKSQAITINDLNGKAVIPKFGPEVTRIPLRSEASPEAKLVSEVTDGAPLTVLDRQLLKWGHVKMNEQGTFWWSIDDENTLPKVWNETLKITTSELFGRKIYDMVSSPEIPYLKFASAKGIFKTMDGKNWEQISQFKDENYPLAVSQSGVIFVGAFASFDHGESFEPYLRWENLITAARVKYHSSPRFLQILKVSPLDEAGDQIELKMDLGMKTPSKFKSRDHGLTWQAI